MAKPTKKSPGIEKFLTHTLGGTSRTDSIEKDICALCGKSAKKFKDSKSAREYTISGMCQACQDSLFGESLIEAATCAKHDYSEFQYPSKPGSGTRTCTQCGKTKKMAKRLSKADRLKKARRALGKEHVVRETIREELHRAELCECVICRLKDLSRLFGLQPSNVKDLGRLLMNKPSEKEKVIAIAKFGKETLGLKGPELKTWTQRARSVLLGHA